jgi:hypothetical protein
MVNVNIKNNRFQHALRIALLTFVFFAILIFEYSKGWLFLGKTKIDFGDLAYIVNCGQGLNIDKSFFSNNGCSAYMYGSINLRIVEVLNLKDSSIIAGGFVFFFFTSLIFSVVNNHLFGKHILLGTFGTLIFFSPPIELILERANLDALIFILVIASALLFANKKIVFSIFLLAICSLMKFYTLPLLILVSFISASSFKRFKFLQLYLAFILVICAVDIYRVPSFPWDARNMFGIPIYAEYLSFVLQGPNSHSNRIFATSLGLIIFALVMFSIIKLSKRFSIFPSDINSEISRNQLAVFLFS